MSYYFSATLQTTFADACDRITNALRNEGFGILTTIDVSDTLKKKLNVDFRKYVILGACNPHFAYEALQAEDKIGTLLPCSVVVQEIPGVGTELAAVDPAASLTAVHNPALETIARQVGEKLKRAIDRCV